jgi:predicted KAP-like P-loop ATPase
MPGDAVSADHPVVDPADDRLGYAPFARHLAVAIANLSGDAGVAIALCGPWGAGKTSVIHLTKHYLNEEQPALELIDFNPWWFSGREDLLRRFFAQLHNAIGEESRLTDLRKRLAEYADLITMAPVPLARQGGALARLTAPRAQDVVALKRSVAELLSKNDQRYVIFIDDIDRLTDDEIVEVFRLIKTVGDFPNIVYVLSFDRSIAQGALSRKYPNSGADYLEKIVQVIFDLPLPRANALQRMFFEKLEQLLATYPTDEPVDLARWRDMYYPGIDSFVRTPRDVVRLMNSLNISFPVVYREVDAVDFIGIECLRVFSPNAYDAIRNNEEYFTVVVDRLRRDRSDEELKEFHGKWLDAVPEDHRVGVAAIARVLFPTLPDVFGRRTTFGDRPSRWRQEKRVCVADTFEPYFALAPPSGSVSGEELNAVLTSCVSAADWSAALRRLSSERLDDGTSKLESFLLRVQDHTAELRADASKGFLRAIYEIGDELIREADEPAGIFEFGLDLYMGQVVRQLLARFDEPDRFAMLEDAAQNGAAVSTIVDDVAGLGQQHGRFGDPNPMPEADRVVTSGHLDTLEQVALERIRAAAGSGDLLTLPRLTSIIWRWLRWDEAGCRAWVADITREPEGLRAILVSLAHRVRSQGADDVTMRVHFEAKREEIEPFLDPDSVMDALNRLISSRGGSETEDDLALRAVADALNETSTPDGGTSEPESDDS